MDPRKPLLLVDVDGVLNPYTADVCPAGYREYHFFPDQEPVRLAQVHGEWLLGLAEAFDLVWATGWVEMAHRHISPVLGLPRLPAIVFPPRRCPAPGVSNPARAETEPLGAEAFLTDLCRGVCDSTT